MSLYGHSAQYCLKMACYLKTVGHRLKKSEIWDSGAVVTFGELVFKAILGLFSAVVSLWPVTLKPRLWSEAG